MITVKVCTNKNPLTEFMILAFRFHGFAIEPKNQSRSLKIEIENKPASFHATHTSDFILCHLVQGASYHIVSGVV